MAEAYYWHRFFSHQPDLNFDNPAVREAMFKVVDFWLDLGVDGLRLDAVPYLYEREGTNCENLPETHAFLKKLRAHVDGKYEDRMLLAEANQWPEDAVAYFGQGRGDECHMAFHFPLMPRLFMAVRMEDRTPIVDILEQTPPIPETSQWALFLRNHDELTLEMVTDEERDYMYRMYAHVQQARLNLGIRRRLAPLLGNDRKRIELLNGLLLSLPGTPVLYYGDEIGMGDNIYLGDRNGVRTPMQWSADRNAGFSRANPQRLYLPITLDPEYHYEAINVEAQLRNPHSLLWWMRRVLALRKNWRALGEGRVEFLAPQNRKVLAYILRFPQSTAHSPQPTVHSPQSTAEQGQETGDREETLLVVANLSRFPQPVELDLSMFKGRTPFELFGRTRFPGIGDLPYFLTPGPHNFYIFSLEAPVAAATQAAQPAPEPGAVLVVGENWEALLAEKPAPAFEKAFAAYLRAGNRLASEGKVLKSATLQEALPVPLLSPQSTVQSPQSVDNGPRIVDGGQETADSGLRTRSDAAYLTLWQIEFAGADPEWYAAPLAFAPPSEAARLRREEPHRVIAAVSLARSGEQGVVYDALGMQEFDAALLELIARRRRLKGRQGNVVAWRGPLLRELSPQAATSLKSGALKTPGPDTSVRYGEQFVLKLYRRVLVGVNPGLEVGRFLTERGFPYAPPLAGALEYHRSDGERLSLAGVHAWAPKTESGWEFTSRALDRYYERALSVATEQPEPPSARHVAVQLARQGLPAEVLETVGTYLESARILGSQTAALHQALAADPSDPDFAPELITSFYQRGLYQTMRNAARNSLHRLREELPDCPKMRRRRAGPSSSAKPTCSSDCSRCWPSA